MSRKRIWPGLVLVLVVSGMLALAAPGLAVSEPPQVGEPFPDLKLPAPKASEHREYLGLESKTGSTFTVGQVKARVVILEVFSMYCPYCQNEAPSINALYNRIAERGLEDKIKLIGLGAGNSSYEVDLFKGKFGIRFPLLPDNDLGLHTALGKVRTPYFIAVSLDSGRKQEVIYSKVGTIGDPGQFLDHVIRQAGLQ